MTPVLYPGSQHEHFNLLCDILSYDIAREDRREVAYYELAA